MATIETPVLIVGAGPVGLALAADLGSRGVPCLAVEQGDGVPEHPRASAINARSMEFMRRWGIADKVREVGTPPDFPHTALYCTTLVRLRDRAHRAPAPRRHGAEARPARSGRSAATSSGSTRCCASSPRATPASTSATGIASRALREDGDRVIATVHDLVRDQRIEIAAPYVIDCSGGHSPIRRQLGIGMSGSSYVGYFISIFVRAPELWTHHTMGKAALCWFVDAKGLWRNYVNLDGRELYRFGISGKAFYDEPDKVDAERHFREVVGKDVPHEILSVVRWQRAQRGGRPLPGRAASSWPATPRTSTIRRPGLGSTPGSATPSISAGSSRPCMPAGAALPCSTPTRPSGGRSASAMSATPTKATPATASGRPAPPLPTTRRRARAPAARMGDAIVASQTKKVITDGLALGYRYDPSPIVWPDGTPAPEYTVTDYHPTARPGSRAPHAWLGEGRSTIDLFGKGFVLMRLRRRRRTSRRSSAPSRSAACR